jgi:V/A-type H+-transporting ATPase subunit C
LAEQYTYAVARIRAKELTLLSRQDLDQLLACKTEQDCLRFLVDKGWGEAGMDGEEMLSQELDKTWSAIRELVPDFTAFAVFLYPVDFGNLKAAIKSTVAGNRPERLYVYRGSIEPEVLELAAQKHDFSRLPAFMREAATQAFQTLLHTGDGQLCDVILDRAALAAVLQAGKDSDSPLIQEYAELTVATANIKIAVRGQKTGKTREFLQQAMVPCDSLRVGDLMEAAVSGRDALEQYLSNTRYARAAEELKRSSSAFERWCDNEQMNLIRSQKTNPFTIGPLAAYILARESEIKAVRLILSGKRNHLDEEAVKERLRDLYV